MSRQYVTYRYFSLFLLLIFICSSCNSKTSRVNTTIEEYEKNPINGYIEILKLGENAKDAVPYLISKLIAADNEKQFVLDGNCIDLLGLIGDPSAIEPLNKKLAKYLKLLNQDNPFRHIDIIRVNGGDANTLIDTLISLGDKSYLDVIFDSEPSDNGIQIDYRPLWEELKKEHVKIEQQFWNSEDTHKSRMLRVMQKVGYDDTPLSELFTDEGKISLEAQRLHNLEKDYQKRMHLGMFMARCGDIDAARYVIGSENSAYPASYALCNLPPSEVNAYIDRCILDNKSKLECLDPYFRRTKTQSPELVLKLIDVYGKPENANKQEAIIEFMGTQSGSESIQFLRQLIANENSENKLLALKSLAKSGATLETDELLQIIDIIVEDPRFTFAFWQFDLANHCEAPISFATGAIPEKDPKRSRFYSVFQFLLKNPSEAEIKQAQQESSIQEIEKFYGMLLEVRKGRNPLDVIMESINSPDAINRKLGYIALSRMKPFDVKTFVSLFEKYSDNSGDKNIIHAILREHLTAVINYDREILGKLIDGGVWVYIDKLAPLLEAKEWIYVVNALEHDSFLNHINLRKPLYALKAHTGQNFLLDFPAWHRWFEAQYGTDSKE